MQHVTTQKLLDTIVLSLLSTELNFLVTSSVLARSVENVIVSDLVLVWAPEPVCKKKWHRQNDF